MPTVFSPASRRRLSAVTAAGVALTMVTGCSDGAGGCEQGASAPETALNYFLSAAEETDLGAMQAHVFPTLTVSNGEFAAVVESLDGYAVDELFLTEHQEVYGRFQYRVTTQSGELLSEWEVGEMDEPNGGCYAVAWGSPEEEEGGPPTPTPITTAESVV